MVTLTPRLQAIFKENRSVCFGRFLITIPATATVVYGPAQAETPIDFYRGDAHKIDELVATRLTEIEKEREYLTAEDKAKLTLFGHVRDGAIRGQKIVIGSKNQVGYAVHSYVPIGDDLFVQYLSSLLPDEDPFELMNSVARQLQSRPENVIPIEPGACIEGGLVAKEMTYEQIAIGIRLKEYPDVHMSIEIHRNVGRLAESSSLELLLKEGDEAAREAGAGFLFDRIKIFRHGARALGDWKGFEHASRIPAHKKNTDSHEFFYQSLGAIQDALLPKLEITLDTGVKGDSKASVVPSITDDEALAIWDKLITTIRVRQPGDATPVKTPMPLATLSKTGERCAETGWWECMESTPVKGDPRRLFMAGEPFPPVVKVAEPTAWQKLTGTRQEYPIPTTWKLVDYAEHHSPQ